MDNTEWSLQMKMYKSFINITTGALVIGFISLSSSLVFASITETVCETSCGSLKFNTGDNQSPLIIEKVEIVEGQKKQFATGVVYNQHIILTALSEDDNEVSCEFPLGMRTGQFPLGFDESKLLNTLQPESVFTCYLPGIRPNNMVSLYMSVGYDWKSAVDVRVSNSELGLSNY